MYDKADWKKMHEEVSKSIADNARVFAPSTKGDLELAVDKLEASVNRVLEGHIARAKPSPYAKR